MTTTDIIFLVFSILAVYAIAIIISIKGAATEETNVKARGTLYYMWFTCNGEYFEEPQSLN